MNNNLSKLKLKYIRRTLSSQKSYLGNNFQKMPFDHKQKIFYRRDLKL